MNSFEKTAFNRALNILTALKCQYAIITPSGDKHGGLRVAVDKPEPEYEYGEVTRYVEGFIKDIPIGAVATVEVGKYPIDKVQGACLNWFHKRHGAGSATTNRNKQANTVNVMRIA